MNVVKMLMNTLAFLVLLAFNFVVFGFVGPAFISEPSTIAVIAGVCACGSMFMFDLFVVISLIDYYLIKPRKPS
jgi:hypothetical protein